MTQATKRTTDKLNLNKNLNFCVSKNNQESEKKIHRIGKNSYKLYFW